MLEATVLGDIEAYVVRPGPSPDERFHRFVTEQLDEWGRSNLPGLEAVRDVGEEWAALDLDAQDAWYRRAKEALGRP